MSGGKTKEAMISCGDISAALASGMDDHASKLRDIGRFYGGLVKCFGRQTESQSGR